MTDQQWSVEDQRWMERALQLAHAAAEAGEVPVGAVVVREGQCLGEGSNSPISSSDPSAHAEINALRQAAAAEGNYRLPGTTLYVTIEPCTMCIGALLHARVERLVFAAPEPRAGAAISHLRLPEQPIYNHTLAVSHGLFEDQAAKIMKGFFRRRR